MVMGMKMLKPEAKGGGGEEHVLCFGNTNCFVVSKPRQVSKWG